MPSSNLARWGGLAAAVGGVLLVIWGFLLILIFSPMGVLGPLYGLFIALWCLSWLLVLGGLVGLHARQANVYGRLGAARFAIAFVGVWSWRRSRSFTRSGLCPVLTPGATGRG
jgi:hypothetical protein